MDAATYRQETARTWQTDGLTWREEVANATLGLVGELGEFSDDPTPDELGDCYYYAATLDRLLEEHGGLRVEPVESYGRMPWDEVDAPHALKLAVTAGRYAASVAEAAKKWCYHDGEPGPVGDALVLVYQALRAMAYSLGTYPESIMQMNIDKLRARHPNGWDPDYNSERQV